MTAIITGATKGIGKAVTEFFAKNGFDVAICARTKTDLDLFAEELKIKYGIKVFNLATDMSDKKAVQNFGKFILNNCKTIDVLINNAGVFIPCELSDPNSSEAFEKMMQLNMLGTFYITQHLLPSMIKAKKGHIFNICSIASIMPYGAYAVSKHAMLGFSKVLRDEVKENNIRVTAVLPGATYTNSWEGTDLPNSRFMPAEDIAKSIWDIYKLSDRTVVEEILLRPQLGDI